MATPAEDRLQQVLDAALSPLQQQMEQLQTQMTELSQSFLDSTASLSQHPAGLCQEETCEICVGEAQEIANRAMAQGRDSMVKDIDEYLLQAGGEPLRERFAQVVKLGQQIAEEKGLVVAL